MKLRRPSDMPDPSETEELIKDLDRRLDACFLAEVAPALERARRARGEQATSSGQAT
jgi:hypothetical protein